MSQKSLSLFIALGLMGFFYFTGRSLNVPVEIAEEVPDEGEEQPYLVEKVLDGDTIKLHNGETVRLLGLDAPEKTDCYGGDSTEFLRARLEKQFITLHTDSLNESLDQYGRWLRYVYLDDRNVNLEAVLKGASEFYNEYDLSMETEFEIAEAAAKEAEVGLWGECYLLEDPTFEITHVFYDGEVPRVESDEYVEIKNVSSERDHLEGYSIFGSKGIQAYQFDRIFLKPGEAVRVYTDQPGEFSFGSDEALWSNSGETVYLSNEAGVVVDVYDY